MLESGHIDWGLKYFLISVFKLFPPKEDVQLIVYLPLFIQWVYLVSLHVQEYISVCLCLTAESTGTS